jgi:hypothetical protein
LLFGEKPLVEAANLIGFGHVVGFQAKDEVIRHEENGTPGSPTQGSKQYNLIGVQVITA